MTDIEDHVHNKQERVRAHTAVGENHGTSMVGGRTAVTLRSLGSDLLCLILFLIYCCRLINYAFPLRQECKERGEDIPHIPILVSLKTRV